MTISSPKLVFGKVHRRSKWIVTQLRCRLNIKILTKKRFYQISNGERDQNYRPSMKLNMHQEKNKESKDKLSGIINSSIEKGFSLQNFKNLFKLVLWLCASYGPTWLLKKIYHSIYSWAVIEIHKKGRQSNWL